MVNVDITGIEQSMDSIKRLKQDMKTSSKIIEQTFKRSIDRTDTSLKILEHKLRAASNTLKNFVVAILEVSRILEVSIVRGFSSAWLITKKIARLMVIMGNNLIKFVETIHMFSQILLIEIIKVRDDIDFIIASIFEVILNNVFKINESIIFELVKIEANITRDMLEIYVSVLEVLGLIKSNFHVFCDKVRVFFNSTFNKVIKEVSSGMMKIQADIKVGLSQIINLSIAKLKQLEKVSLAIVELIGISTKMMIIALIETTKVAMNNLFKISEVEAKKTNELFEKLHDKIIEVLIDRGIDLLVDKFKLRVKEGIMKLSNKVKRFLTKARESLMNFASKTFKRVKNTIATNTRRLLSWIRKSLIPKLLGIASAAFTLFLVGLPTLMVFAPALLLIGAWVIVNHINKNASGGIFTKPTFFRSPGGEYLRGRYGVKSINGLPSINTNITFNSEDIIWLDSKMVSRIVGKRLVDDIKLRTLMSY